MTKVLYVHGGVLRYGGTEGFMMNYWRHFDRERIQIDFLTHTDTGEKGVYDDEILAGGGRMFFLPIKSKHPLQYTKVLKELLQRERYDAVHSHADAANAGILSVAKQVGVPLRVSHSHNTATQTANMLKKWYNDREKRRIPSVATHLLACSRLAGEWLYGDTDFTVVSNAIEPERFAFRQDVREAVRREWQWENATVIGHIGRFCYQKNQAFLIESFRRLYERHPEMRLLMVGEGEDESAVRELITRYGLTEAVRVVGPTPRVAEFYQAMDVFALPSRFEGLPIVLLEAQAAGLPCIVSDSVSSQSNITGHIQFLPTDDAEKWSQVLETATALPRYESRLSLQQAGYDITQQAHRLQKLYETGEWE